LHPGDVVKDTPMFYLFIFIHTASNLKVMAGIERKYEQEQVKQTREKQ